MEAIHVFVGIDGVDNGVGINLVWQRQLHQDSVHIRIRVQLIDQTQQFSFARSVRELMLKGFHAGLERLLALVAHIDLACRILAYQHDRQAGGESMIALQAADCRTHALSQTLGKCLTVDSLCHDDSFD